MLQAYYRGFKRHLHLTFKLASNKIYNMYKKFRTCEERKAFMYEPIQNKNTSQLIVDQIKNMILINLLK